MKRVLIVEDNKKAVLLLKKIFKDIGGNIEVETAYEAETAKLLLVKKDFDLFVVDIILNSLDASDASGLNFIEYLRGIKQYEYAPVVITTSVAEMKDHAYDILDCYKYLEKPYDYNRAKEVLTKALNMPLNYDVAQYIHIKCDGIVHVLKWTEIVAVYYDDRKITIQMINGTMSIYYKSLADMYSMLPSRNFIKCSKSTIINKSYVTAVDKKKGRIYLKKPFESVSIGISFRKKVFEELLGED